MIRALTLAWEAFTAARDAAAAVLGEDEGARDE